MFHFLAFLPQSLEQAISHLSVLQSSYPVCMAVLPHPPPYRPPVSGLIAILLFIIGTTQCWEAKAFITVLPAPPLQHLAPSAILSSVYCLPLWSSPVTYGSFCVLCLSIRYHSIVKLAVSHLETSNPHLLLENRCSTYQ